MGFETSPFDLIQCFDSNYETSLWDLKLTVRTSATMAPETL